MKAWPAMRWPLVLGALFVGALTVRLWFLERLRHSPFWGTLDVDSRLYWDWASALLENAFRGVNPFFLGPLYPYLLAVLRAAFGNSLGSVLVVQSLWGALAVVLIADAARRLTTPWAGATIGGLIAVYQMAVFFDGLILMESFLFCLESLLLWLVVRARWNPPGAWTMVLLGTIIGVLAQGRATAVLLLIPAILSIRLAVRDTRAAARHAGLLVAVCAFMAAPSVIHNRIVAHEWIPYTYNLGFNLYVGNNPEATGSFVVTTGMMGPIQLTGERSADGGAAVDGRAFLREAEGRELTPAESSREWADRAFRFAAEHPTRALEGACKRVLMLWNRQEYAQIESIDVFSAVVGPIGLPVVGSFACLCILAFPGLRAMWRNGPAGRFVIGYAVALTIAIVPFFVVDRYRLHLVPGVALLAGVGLTEVVARARRFGVRSAALLLLPGALVVALPMPGYDKERRAWEIAATVGGRWLDRGRPEVAAPELAKAIRIDEAGRLRGAGATSARLVRAEVYSRHATALTQLGRPEQALHSYERAYDLVPGAREASALAAALAMAGAPQRSRALYARFGISDSAAIDALLREAALADRAGRGAQVERILGAAIALDSTHTVAWVALIRLQVQAGRVDRAEDTLDRARAAGLGRATYLAHAALIAVSRGDLPRARRALDQIPRSARDSDPGLTPVLEYVRARLDEGTGRLTPIRQ